MSVTQERVWPGGTNERGGAGKRSTDREREKFKQTTDRSWCVTGFSQAVTSLRGKDTSCLFLSASDLRGVRRCLRTQSEGHTKTQQRSPVSQISCTPPSTPSGARIACTVVCRHMRQHTQSYTVDWVSAGRKWNTPLDLNRKQPGKEDSDRMYAHRSMSLNTMT